MQVVAASLDDLGDARRAQDKLPHLIVVSDAERGLAGAAEVIGPHQSPHGGDTVSPTTVLIDRRGQVRWVFRPDRFIERLPAADVLAKVEEHFGRLRLSGR